MTHMKLFTIAVVYASLREHSATDVHSSKKHEKHTHKKWTMVKGGCKEPGAGMDDTLGLKKVYKDGYFHVRCMMDKMEKSADWHDELQREHLYNIHTNVSIVRYTDRVDVEKQEKMTPKVCFDFCRTVPDMLHFGLTAGRDCYCAPYFMQGPGDGVCDAGCEGDATITCGNTNGMSDVYEMHSCNDAVQDAKDAVTSSETAHSDAKLVYDMAGSALTGVKAATDDIDDKELRDGMMEFSTFINKEYMTLGDTMTECEELTKECKKLADAAAPDTLDWEVIGPIEEAKDAMMTCVAAMDGDSKTTKDIVESPEFAATLAVADLDLDSIMALAEA